MKLRCAFCGFRNADTATKCAQCANSLDNATPEKLRIPWASWFPALPVVAFLWWHHSNVQAIQAAWLEESNQQREHRRADQLQKIRKLEASFGRTEAEEEAKHRAWLSDEKIVSGRQAAEHHATEWSRRQAHDPEFANSLLEKTLVEVERLGKDPALTAEAALRKVAEIVAPRGSRIEITPAGDRFIIRVAFRLSAVARHEAGAGTMLRSPLELRKAVEEASARLIKDLFDYCGARGIERLSVSCNRAINAGHESSPRLEMRSLFRASVDASTAARIANWRAVPLTEVPKLMKVEHDLTSRLTISPYTAPSAPVDPNLPLEF